MRYIFTLLILVLVSSCASNKIKLVKNKDYNRVVVVDNTLSKKKPSTRTKEKLTPPKEEQILTRDKENLHEFSIEIKEDTIISTTQKLNGADILDQARKAEKKAKKARTQAILGGSFNLVSFIIFPLIIVALIMLILSLVNFLKANNSRYITPVGDRALTFAKIMLIISAVLFTIFVAAILLLILL